MWLGILQFNFIFWEIEELKNIQMKWKVSFWYNKFLHSFILYY